MQKLERSYEFYKEGRLCTCQPARLGGRKEDGFLQSCFFLISLVDLCFLNCFRLSMWVLEGGRAGREGQGCVGALECLQVRSRVLVYVSIPLRLRLRLPSKCPAQE